MDDQSKSGPGLTTKAMVGWRALCGTMCVCFGFTLPHIKFTLFLQLVMPDNPKYSINSVRLFS